MMSSGCSEWSISSNAASILEEEREREALFLVLLGRNCFSVGVNREDRVGHLDGGRGRKEAEGLEGEIEGDVSFLFFPFFPLTGETSGGLAFRKDPTVRVPGDLGMTRKFGLGLGVKHIRCEG